MLLVTAKPSWVRAEPDVTEPVSWRYLSYFEENYVRVRGARLAATLTGDLHHYSRYAPKEGDGPERITAGGGGAYLSSTHTLPRSLRLRSLRAGASAPYERQATYPSPEQSKRLRRGVFWLGFKNPGFARLMSVVYILLAATSLAAVGAGRGSLVATAERGNWFDYLAAAFGGATIVVAFVLVLALVLYADAGRFPFKALVGALRAALHLAVLELPLWLLLELFEPGVASFWPFAAGLLLAAALGFLIGPVIFAAVLLAVSVARGGEARKHANEVFASQAITGWKNFLRLHVARDGTLTIYPLGVAQACEEWDAYARSAEHARPHFVPRREPPRAELIEEPIELRL